MAMVIKFFAHSLRATARKTPSENPGYAPVYIGEILISVFAHHYSDYDLIGTHKLLHR